MKARFVALALLTTALLLTTTTFVTIPAHASPEYGPKVDYLLGHIYENPDAEFLGFEKGEIDVIDWSLSKDWIDKWAGNPDIQMRDYYEMAYMVLDMNWLRWPTGHYHDRVGTDPLTQKFNPNDVRDIAAMHFRKALAYMNNKARYVADVLMGLGYPLTTDMPYPSMAGYVDLTDPELIVYTYNTAKADQELLLGGFHDFNNDGKLEWDGDSINQVNPADPSTWTINFDGVGYEALPALLFWARLDDPDRGDSADILQAEIATHGITVDYRKRVRAECYPNVMLGSKTPVYVGPDHADVTGAHNFNLYTGGWIFTSPDIDWLYSLYGGMFYTERPGAFAYNYGGFILGDGNPGGVNDVPDNDDYNIHAANVFYNTVMGDFATPGTIKYEAQLCQKLVNKYVAHVPWFSEAGVKAYRTKGSAGNPWTGTVNMQGYGVDIAGGPNKYGFLNMYSLGDNILDYGWKSSIEKLSVISSEWLWDWSALMLVYDSEIYMNPYRLDVDYPWLAVPRAPGSDGKLGTADHPEWGFDDVYCEFGTWADGALMTTTWTIRSDVKFHNGDPLTPKDIKFSGEFVRDLGPAVAWNWPGAMDVAWIDTQASDPTLGANEIKDYWYIPSTRWAVHWCGYMPIINHLLWLAANTRYGWGYKWPFGQTYLTQNEAKDATTLHVASTAYFAVDDKIWVSYWAPYGAGDMTEYTVTAKTTNTLTISPGLAADAAEFDPVIEVHNDFNIATWDPMPVGYEYTPWQVSGGDGNNNGIPDLKEDGTGPFIYENWDPVGARISYTANKGATFYKSQAEIEKLVGESFHLIGSVNYPGSLHQAEYPMVDMSVLVEDGMYIGRSFGFWTYPNLIGKPAPGYPEGIIYGGYFNTDADCNRDGYVFTYDLWAYGAFYGSDAG